MKDSITINGIPVDPEEYKEICDKADRSKVNTYGEDPSPIRDYAFQLGYVMGSLSIKDEACSL